MPRFDTSKQFLAVRRPRRRQVDVRVAKIQAVTAEVVVGRHLDDGARTPVVDGGDEHVEEAVRRGRDVGQALAVGRPGRFHVDVIAGRDRGRFARGQVQDPHVDALAVVVRGVGKITTVGRILGRGEEGRLAQHFLRDAVGPAVGHAHTPQRSVHGEGQAHAVGRPGGPPRRAARGGRQIVVVHVVAARLGGGIGLRRGERGSERRQQSETKDEFSHGETIREGATPKSPISRPARIPLTSRDLQRLQRPGERPPSKLPGHVRTSAPSQS